VSSVIHSPEADDRFAFTSETAPAANPFAAELDAERTIKALGSTGHVTYHWDIASDTITWSRNTKAVLGFEPQQVKTGRQFAEMMDRENFFSRYDTVLRSTQRDAGNGVAYEIEYRLKPNGQNEARAVWIEDVGRWFGGADGRAAEATGVMRIADARHARDQEMNFLSNCDHLTGMMNRARMTDALGEAISVAAADGNPCAFAIIAVNNLDVMNEAYGFEVADEVIVALGQRLRRVMRMGDCIARYSGSKFGVILNGCAPKEMHAALERFMMTVRDSVIETSMGPVWALLSIGAVSLPALGDTPGMAIAHAEEALSEAFRLPSDGHVIFTSSDERKARRLLNARCATEIVNCLRDGLFKLAFQPIHAADGSGIVLHEALLRMEDSSGALITAGHLVPIAERLGLVRLIDRAVLQLALQTLQGHPDASLSINISATTVTDPRWNIQLIDMIAASKDCGKRLIEITETAALGNLSTSRDFVSALRNLGCAVALDDFGAGYTSYRNLKELPLTHIKLDGSYCTDLHEGSENYAFVQSMVHLAHAFGLKVIAEWVETEKDVEALVTLGVTFLQGNLLGEASVNVPWKNTESAGFRFANSSLAPVDTSHFSEPSFPVEEPRNAREDELPQTFTSAATDAPVSFDTDVRTGLADASNLDDATLNAEIAEAAHSTSDGFEVSVEPLYETALAADTNGSAMIHNDEESSATDDHLVHLKQALAELTTAFGPREDRLAS
jgi:diguanylate cyclase (GGDEF)-like protein